MPLACFADILSAYFPGGLDLGRVSVRQCPADGFGWVPAASWRPQCCQHPVKPTCRALSCNDPDKVSDTLANVCASIQDTLNRVDEVIRLAVSVSACQALAGSLMKLIRLRNGFTAVLQLDHLLQLESACRLAVQRAGPRLALGLRCLQAARPTQK